MILTALPNARWTRKPDPGTDLDRNHPLCPDYCWPFLSPQGTAHSLARFKPLQAPTTLSDIYAGSSSIVPGRKYGLSVRHGATTDIMRLTADLSAGVGFDNEVGQVVGDQTGQASHETLQGVTILLCYRKTDVTLRAAYVLAVNDASVAAQCAINIPYSDGNIYWAYGGTTPNVSLLTVASGGLTLGDDLWTFTTGVRGMECWQNGILRGSNTGNSTRGTVAGNAHFGWDGLASPATDLADIALIMTWRRQLTKAEVMAVSANPWQVFQPRIVLFASPPAQTASGSATGVATVLGVGLSTAAAVGSALGAASLSVGAPPVFITGSASVVGLGLSAAAGTGTAVGSASFAASFPSGIGVICGVASVLGVSPSTTTWTRERHDRVFRTRVQHRPRVRRPIFLTPPSVGAAAGHATVTGAGSSTAGSTATGVASATGQATVTGRAPSLAVFTITGHATVLGGTGGGVSATGHATAFGIGGPATVTGTGTWTGAIGLAVGMATVTGVGSYTAASPATGVEHATGSASVVGVGTAIVSAVGIANGSADVEVVAFSGATFTILGAATVLGGGSYGAEVYPTGFASVFGVGASEADSIGVSVGAGMTGALGEGQSVQGVGPLIRWQGFSRLNNSADPAPLATVTVYDKGTQVLANIYSANDLGQPKANPFTAGLDGFAYFYAANGRYDVQFSNGGIVVPWAYGDLVLYDPGNIGN